MPRVLLLECSPNDLASPGGQLAREMARRIHPKAEVIVRNLVREPLPPLWAGYAEAVVGKSDSADEHFALSEQLIGELERSHYLLISTPMHNYMVPAVLKLWLDYVVRIHRTFEIHNGRRDGLLEDRPTFVVLSSGGHYLGAKAKQMDFLSPYLRHVLGIIGLHHVEFIHLQGLADGEDAVAAALTQARERLSFNPVFAPEPFPDVVL